MVDRQLARLFIPSAGMVAQAHAPALKRHQGILQPRERAAELLHRFAGNRPAIARIKHPFSEPLIEELRLHFVFGLNVVDVLFVAHAKQRRLGNIHMPRGHELVHLPVEKRQQQRANVRAVNVGVGHDNDLVIPAFAQIGLVANPGANRRDDAAHLLVGEDLVLPALVGIDDLAPQRQDCLVFPAPASLGAATGGIALHQIEFAFGHIAAGAVAQLARQATPGQGPFPLAQQGLCFLGGGPRFRSEHSFLRNRLGAFGILLEVFGEEIAHRRIDDPLHLAVAEFGFGLPLKLRFGHAHAHHGGEPLADVLAGGNQILVETRLLAVGVEAARQRRAKPGDVRASLGRRDVVDIAVEILGELPGVLQSDVKRDAVLHPPDRNHIGMDRIAGAVEPLHEFDDAAVVAERLGLAAGGIVKADFHAGIEKGEFLQAAREHIPGEFRGGENLGIGLERGFGADAGGGADFAHRSGRLAALVFLLPNMAVAGNLHLAPFREKIHHRHTDAMEAAGGLVGPLLKLATKFQHRHHALERGNIAIHLLGKLGVPLDRNAAAVVLHRHAAIDIHRHAHLSGMARHAFVDGVVDHFIDQMVETAGGVVADVHAKPLAHMLAIGEMEQICRRIPCCQWFFSHTLRVASRGFCTHPTAAGDRGRTTDRSLTCRDRPSAGTGYR